MNHQTRRDQAYKRNMQEWLDLYVRLEREDQAFYAAHAHIQSDADFTPETKAAFDADNQALCADGHYVGFDPDITGNGRGWHLNAYTYTTAR